jgi:inhibitor of KinA
LRSVPSLVEPVFRAVSDCGVLVEFGTVLSDAVHEAVLALDAALATDPVVGQVEVVPAYVNVMVVFDPLVTSHDAGGGGVRARLGRGTVVRGSRVHEVPVTYDGADLTAVAERTGLSVDAVVAAHLAGEYSVYLYGFAPGYAYLGGVPEAIRVPRKEAPVRGVAAGSVIIAGAQCIVTTLTMPTGWWVIGHSGVQILRPEGMLFEVGDRLRFVAA